METLTQGQSECGSPPFNFLASLINGNFAIKQFEEFLYHLLTS